ncbi:MAG: hypothetical protein IPJ48_00990 [Propionivibrio sp.]|uniref:Uncharacterized protein n=1 Tax=Candidatus Propionivibrio dominans TaxID=2954373 RepID=A0A9D7I746_9RHOO|nr:hypothetical protein [Candidatus Propionivibrio dominans]MBL0168056.1 hypothetical protein [Propionivibrio sp.]
MRAGRLWEAPGFGGNRGQAGFAQEIADANAHAADNGLPPHLPGSMVMRSTWLMAHSPVVESYATSGATGAPEASSAARAASNMA